MPHFVIEFQATLDGAQIERGQIGSSSSTNDYSPNTVKGVITQHYKQLFPNVKHIAVVLVNVKTVTIEDYVVAAKSFIRLSKS